MEVKNGIVIDGILHEGTEKEMYCTECSLYNLCAKNDYSVCLEDVLHCGGFVEVGKVKIEKEK